MDGDVLRRDYRGDAVHMGAIAGIDHALWDIKSKALNVPVHQLLGDKLRDRIRVYSWIAAAAKEVAVRGFTAIKKSATEELQYLDSHAKLDTVLSRVEAIRDALGPDFGIAVDFHGRVHRPMAKVLAKELDAYRLMFIEEPVLSEHGAAPKEIADHCAPPIALGERLFSRWDFKKILHDGYVDVIQPDPSHAGGITETGKIAAMAEAYDIGPALHCPVGPIALAANLQLDAVCYNATNDLLDYLVGASVFDYRDGHVAIPDRPALGIEVNEEFVRREATEGHRWRNPVWRHANGSFAEW